MVLALGPFAGNCAILDEVHHTAPGSERTGSPVGAAAMTGKKNNPEGVRGRFAGVPLKRLLAAAVILMIVPLIGVALSLQSVFTSSRDLATDPRWVVGRFHSDVLYYAIDLNHIGETVDQQEAQRLQVDVAILRNRLFVVESGATRRLLSGRGDYESHMQEAERLVVSHERMLRPVANGDEVLLASRLRPTLERLQRIAEDLASAAGKGEEASRNGYLTSLGRSLGIAAVCLLILLIGTVVFLVRAVQQSRQLNRTLAAKVHAEGWQRKLLKALEQSPVAVLLADRTGLVEYVNRAFTAMSERSESEIIGHRRGIASALPGASTSLEVILEHVLDGGEWAREQRNVRPSGEVYWEYTRVTPIRTDGDNITHLLAIKEDITSRKMHEEEVIRHAYYDGLTGLPNRLLAMDRLEQALVRTLAADTRTAVLFVDLDDFKTINDTFGHDMGDRLLIEVAERLRNVVREGDTVARIGGDEFLIVAEGLVDGAQAERIADKLLEVFERCFSLSGQDFFSACTVGFAVGPDDARDAQTLLKYADAAMYRAKARGKNTWQGFSPSLGEDGSHRLRLEADLRHALERGEFTVHYQPILSMPAGELVGAEALLRWRHPELGMVPLDHFIPLAEALGLIVPIGHWVLGEALNAAALWRRSCPDFRISVNLSPRQTWAEGLAREVQEYLDRDDLPPESLMLEVTEGLFKGNRDSTRELLQGLRDKGVCLAIDDFGTGYASLNHIKRFPISALKIDGTFVRDLPASADDRRLVSSIVAMGRSLGLEVIAEGVETVDQWHVLARAGCHQAQGFLLGDPVPRESFADRYLDSDFAVVRVPGAPG